MTLRSSLVYSLAPSVNTLSCFVHIVSSEAVLQSARNSSAGQTDNTFSKEEDLKLNWVAFLFCHRRFKLLPPLIDIVMHEFS